MPTCEEHEIAIEKRRHGALPAAESAALDAHLASCSACRAFEATSRRTEDAMAAMASEALGEVDWARVERGVRSSMARLVTAFAVMVSMVLALGALAWWTAPAPGRDDATLGFAIGAGLVLAVFATVAAVKTRTMLRLERGPEMLAWLRRDRARRLRVLRLFAFVGPLIAIAYGSRALGGSSKGALWAASAAVVAAGWAFATFVKLPRLRREVADLEQMGR